MEAGMAKSSDELRQYAENCSEIARAAKSNPPKQRRFRRMAQAWESLAKNQDWLDGEPEEHDPKAA